MNPDFFNDLLRFIQFSEEDAARLKAIGPAISSTLPQVADRFYDNLLRFEETRRIFSGGEEQIRRLRNTLLVWLKELFCGKYDDAYFQKRAKIGQVHVSVGLPQHLMFTAMNDIRLSIHEALESIGVAGIESRNAVDRIIDIDLAIMNETYREDLLSNIKAVQQSHFEAQIAESEHLATVGELAASLAHEIKNPLAGISGAMQIIGSGIRNDHPHRKFVDEIMRQVDRVDATVRDLLIFARPKPPERRLSNIADLLRTAIALVSHQPTVRSVKVRIESQDEEKLLAEVDVIQIEQVFGNLVINAAQASEADGEVLCSISRNGHSICIEVLDEGSGIADHVLKRVWEPFYTTKAKGTGLGLAICKRIVETHGGSITLEKRVPKGAKATVCLPLAGE